MTKQIVSFTIPTAVVERLDAVAESEFRSRSSMATALIAKGLESMDSEAQEPAMATEAR